MSLEDRIIELVNSKNKESDGHNGLLLPFMCSKLNTDMSSLKKALNQLYRERKIIVRDGINGKLVFKQK